MEDLKKLEQNNILIASFLYDKYNEYYIINKKHVHEKFLKFHNDWNYLMPVVSKVTTLEEFQNWELNSIFWDAYNQIDITEIYNNVVLFLEYYKNLLNTK